MRGKLRKHLKVHAVHLPHAEPTIRELAEKAVALFNYEGDKTKYVTFLNHYSAEKRSLIVKEMQNVWRGK